MTTTQNGATIADVQSSPDSRMLSIDKVGIRRIRHPVRVRDRSGAAQHTVATFDMYVDRPTISRARDVALRGAAQCPDTRDHRRLVQEILNACAPCWALRRAFVTLPYFVNKAAPVSGVHSLLDYEVTLIGEADDEDSHTLVRVVVPVTSLCPCSKQISDYGAHNQRSHVTVTARTRDSIWIEDIIDLVEEEASCEIYGLLKRPDEKYVTEKAYDNPKFVEDMVRDVAARLNADPRIEAYVLESENFESIHNHSAYAQIRRNM